MKLDDVKKLQQKKYREQFGHFLVEGEHLVLELQKAAQHAPLLASSELYVTAAYEHWQSPFRTHLISDRQMAQLGLRFRATLLICMLAVSRYII